MIRVLSGAALAAVFFAIVWFSSATVLLFVAMGVCVLAFQEYAQLMKQIGIGIPKLPTLVATLAALAIVPFPFVSGEAVVGVGLIVVAVAVMTRLDGGRDGGRNEGRDFSPAGAPDRPAGAVGRSEAIHAIAAAALSIVYLGLPLGALVGVHIFGGRSAVLLLVATIALSDTAQYYTGRLLGRHALAPKISPKKTIEGAVGGFVAAPVFLYFAGPYFVPVSTSMRIAPLGIALVAAGIAGDLFESMIKRAADKKDSSALIPGHGGVLDRIDALLFASPIFYMYLRWLYTV
jgi:CDP-diglyceride synthetase